VLWYTPSKVAGRGCPLDWWLSEYKTKSPNMNNSGCCAWRVPHSFHVNDDENLLKNLFGENYDMENKVLLFTQMSVLRQLRYLGIVLSMEQVI
jgi:hypothetical protein